MEHNITVREMAKKIPIKEQINKVWELLWRKQRAEMEKKALVSDKAIKENLFIEVL